MKLQHILDQKWEFRLAADQESPQAEITPQKWFPATFFIILSFFQLAAHSHRSFDKRRRPQIFCLPNRASSRASTRQACRNKNINSAEAGYNKMHMPKRQGDFAWAGRPGKK